MPHITHHRPSLLRRQQSSGGGKIGRSRESQRRARSAPGGPPLVVQRAIQHQPEPPTRLRNTLDGGISAAVGGGRADESEAAEVREHGTREA